MEHHFHTEIAIKYGVEEAVIIYNLAYWLTHNKANNKNFYDGYYWTYNSARAFEELFPYFNSKKISRLLNKLEEVGAIKSGNYNKVAYDRTKWYAISDEELIKFYKLGEKDKIEKSISQKCPMEKTKMENGIDETVQPIPNNKPDSKPDEKQNIYLPAIKQEIDMLLRTKGLNFSVEELLREAKRDSQLVIQSIKLYGDKGAGYLKDSIKKRYIDNIKQEIKTSKSEFIFDQVRFDRINKLVEVADVSALTNKDRDYYNKCQEYLRG